MALAVKSLAPLAVAKRSVRSVAARPALPARRKVVIRASAEPAPPSNSGPADETLTKLQSSANEAVTWVKAKWEATSDSEKPAAIAIIIGVVVAQIAIGATIDVVDRIPVVSDLLELLGLAVTLYWTYRLTTDEDERDNVKTTVSGFLDKVTGSK